MVLTFRPMARLGVIDIVSAKTMAVSAAIVPNIYTWAGLEEEASDEIVHSAISKPRGILSVILPS